VRHGEEAREKGKRWGKKGMSGWAHMAVREEERWVVDGPAVRWAERARRASGSGGLGGVGEDLAI
jgi:hypothetical protein